MSRRRYEDGTTGRPLGDDEDLDPREYADPPERDAPWEDMSAEERAAAARGVGQGWVS